ncbi:hypothetical protein EDC31_1381, partial [Acidomonas methanolica]
HLPNDVNNNVVNDRRLPIIQSNHKAALSGRLPMFGRAGFELLRARVLHATCG